jgi:iron only hydrogenase large subunit-like protein
MSAILSAEDLNDFISPGVACIKPVETLPKSKEQSNPYEVTTEDKIQAEHPSPASISLTDCLACSGCVTSAEAVLISLQSHTEVLNTLDAHPSLGLRTLVPNPTNSQHSGGGDAKLFVASVSPQVRASLAATYGISEKQAGYMIEQLLSGPLGLQSGGRHGSGFTYVVDTNRMREACLFLGVDEVAQSVIGSSTASRPILTSACPGWICYAEKTHPHVLPHLSKLKSPQALTGTLLKSSLSTSLGIRPSRIWHLAVMPCFDKKLEASREELTDRWWANDKGINDSTSPVRDVDCVITSRELLTLANDRNINLQSLPLTPLSNQYRIPFPNPTISRFLYPKPRRRPHHLIHEPDQSTAAGTSGGYLHHILTSQQSLHPGSSIQTQRGRNADVTEYTLLSSTHEPILKCARFYGFRNIQNLVRKLKPARGSRLPGAAASARRGGFNGRKDGTADVGSEYAYVEVMACPGGCTNGGGQIRVEEAMALASAPKTEETNQPSIDSGNLIPSQREWLKRVDSAYFSASSSDSEPDDQSNHTPSHTESLNNKEEADSDNTMHDPLPEPLSIQAFLSYWSEYTSIPLEKLVYTTFRKVESEVGKSNSKSKKGPRDTERIAALAGSIGGGW